MGGSVYEVVCWYHINAVLFHTFLKFGQCSINANMPYLKVYYDTSISDTAIRNGLFVKLLYLAADTFILTKEDFFRLHMLSLVT